MSSYNESPESASSIHENYYSLLKYDLQEGVWLLGTYN